MQKQNQKNQGKKKKKNRKVEVSKSARIKIQKVYTCSLCPLGPCRQILASRLHFSYLRYFETNWTVLYHLLSLQQLLPSALRLPAPSIMWSSLSPSAWAASSQLHAANSSLPHPKVSSACSAAHQRRTSLLPSLWDPSHPVTPPF